MSESQADRIDGLMRALDTSLHQSTTLFRLLVDEMYGDEAERPDTIDPAPPIASEDPTTCGHPVTLVAGDQRLCNSCGINLDAG